jgi:hypothetical protein
MRFLMTVSALAVATGLFAACGDDSGDDGNTAGTGGTGGRGGTGGTAGTAGAPGNGGTAGTAGAPGNGGTAGTAGAPGNGGTAGTAGTAGTNGGDEPDAGDGGVSESDGGLSDAGDAGAPPCTGCLELRANVTEIGGTQTAFFQTVFGSTDLSGAVVTFTVAGLPGDENVNVTAFATDGDFAPFGAGDSVLVSDQEGFVDVAVDISALTADDAAFDDTDVIAVGIQVDYVDTITDESQAVTVLLDEVDFSDNSELEDLTFTDDEEGFAVNAFAGSQEAEVISHPE